MRLPPGELVWAQTGDLLLETTRSPSSPKATGFLPSSFLFQSKQMVPLLAVVS